MAVRTTTQFKALYGTSGTLFPDNTTAEISEADIRAFGEDIADSFSNESDDAYTSPFPQVTASGTDTYAATTSPAISAYATGQKFQIKFTNASTGVSTLNLNTLGAKKIYINPTTQATVDHIAAGQISLLVYDAALDSASGGFLMIGAPSTASGTVTSVTGTADRITSTGGATPVIDIDPAYDAAITAEIAAAGALKLNSTYGFRPKTDDYTLLSADKTDDDAGVPLNFLMNKATANALIIPPDSDVDFTIGHAIQATQMGVGVTSFQAGVGVTFVSSSGTLNIASQYGSALAIKTAANTWLIQNGTDLDLDTIRPLIGIITNIPILATTSAAFILTNMANAEQTLPLDNAMNIIRFDATYYRQVRIVTRVTTLSASVNNPRLYPQYDDDIPGGLNFVTIGTAAGTEMISLSTTGWKETTWIDLPAGAKGDVWFRIAQHGGDGAADPAIGSVHLQFRM